MKPRARPVRSACTRRQQAFALLCVFLLQFTVESFGGVLRMATPFDDVCRASMARGAEASGRPDGMASYGQHCALCVSASALPPPPLPFALTEFHHAETVEAQAIESHHRIAQGAHWHSRAPPVSA